MNVIFDKERCELDSPVMMPKASGFLWNSSMMLHANCRGYVVSQFMQPEPAKYSHAPNIEEKTFMQPEVPYYTEHPGRFVYVKDENSKEMFSAPYEPMRCSPKKYKFSVRRDKIVWYAENYGIGIEMQLSLPRDEALELWKIKVKNKSKKKRQLSIYPYFTVGYMSWMNQEGIYNPDLQAIVCSSVTPYQKKEDYEAIKNYKDKTFLLTEKEPYAWEAAQEEFGGEGSLSMPDGVVADKLSNGEARYETPVCVFQYRMDMNPSEEKEFRFLFGPAKTEEEIASVRKKYFGVSDYRMTDAFALAESEYAAYIAEGQGCISVKTGDEIFDNFVNTWLPHQIYYHGITNRMTMDPQTRNYLQDHMGMCYIKPDRSRDAFLFALKQQFKNGRMPDGIKLKEDTVLKYINQIPHMDHCVWLPLWLEVYLNETNDYDILNETLPFADDKEAISVFKHIDRGMAWMIKNTDSRGLCLIGQGDWCDPMNMVGYKGKGVSAWLTMAVAYACTVWAEICGKIGWSDKALEYKKTVKELNENINTYFWDGKWYARGITDDNRIFGIEQDREGKIYINPQSWALLCGAPDKEQKELMIKMVEEYLETPYGIEKLSPAYTAMQEDIGRLTQKYPGTAENGSVYNHASVFYIYALYISGEKENAYRLLRKMIPDPRRKDFIQRGQLPVFIPNYFRGAYKQIPKTAGRSSQLFNTGTVAWLYRCIIEELLGIKGIRDGVIISPQLPSEWKKAEIIRRFRGAELDIHVEREEKVNKIEVFVDGQYVPDGVIRNIRSGTSYKVSIKLPVTEERNI